MTISQRDMEYETLQIKFLRGKVKRIAADLRSMAEEVERAATFKDEDYYSVPGKVTSSVLWGVANLNLDRLSDMVRDVVEAQEYSVSKAAEDEAVRSE